MNNRYPRLVIAGLKGGSGKTTLSLGLIAAWRKKGLMIAPYKKGPDYIDAGWLSSAAGRRCYNLDPFLIGRERVLSSFKEHFIDADCAVIEGNRGLYDGMDPEGTYSTAELSKIIKAPVVLILDCTKVTRTVGAMIMGMQKFDVNVEIKGVVLNQIAGLRHEKIIRDVVEKYCSVRVLGAIPKLRRAFLSERHMGLTPFQEHPEVARVISCASETAEKYLDLDLILEIANEAKDLKKRQVASGNGQWAMGEGREIRTREDELMGLPAVASCHSPVIGVIRDSAFQFYYPENFEELQKRGARLLDISAMKEKKLPEIDALYIGGGFPETNALVLAKNASFRRSLKKAVEEGLPVYAECGGLMYLGSALVLDNKKYPMTGIFPLEFSLEKKPQAHGYTVVKVSGKNPFYKKGTILKGHEFHYSNVGVGAGEFKAEVVDSGKGFGFAFSMKRGQGISLKRDGICYKNVLATYTHLHAYGSPEWTDGLIKCALSFRKRREKDCRKEKKS